MTLEGNSAKPPTPPSTVPEGFSQFVARVLDQLSLSSWLPAALLVSAGAVLMELRSQEEIDLVTAVADLSAKPFGILVVMLFAVIAAAVLLQAFELSAIRLLEGYWPSAASRVGLTGMFVRLQIRRRNRLVRRLEDHRKRAFRVAREGLLDAEVNIELINYYKRVAYGEDFDVQPAPEVFRAAQAFDWRRFAPPTLLRSCEALERSVGLYPAQHRIMPTRLGNTLRAGEDEINNLGSGTLRTFVIRHWHLLPLELQVLHDQYRNRLDLYCSLVFVCGALSFGGAALLGTTNSGQLAAIIPLFGFALCAHGCYRASITSAIGYTGALQAIDRHIEGHSGT